MLHESWRCVDFRHSYSLAFADFEPRSLHASGKPILRSKESYIISNKSLYIEQVLSILSKTAHELWIDRPRLMSTRQR
jgi:hypothetical protein